RQGQSHRQAATSPAQGCPGTPASHPPEGARARARTGGSRPNRLCPLVRPGASAEETQGPPAGPALGVQAASSPPGRSRCTLSTRAPPPHTQPQLPARSATSRQGPPSALPGRTPEGPRWGGSGWLSRCLPAGAPWWRNSGPIRAYILARKDAIQLWRTLMGPTRVFRARHMAPDSIRGSFGLTDTRNTTHGSDSVVSASREIAAFFPDFSEQRWYEEEEPQLRCGPVCYSLEGGIHCAAGPGGPGPV
uniref:Nucleoside diphosphate kinase n=1 Tax=Ailuropoda melanoleuca TaxID=9646 RepID=A0A7N5JVW3_AILME